MSTLQIIVNSVLTMMLPVLIGIVCIFYRLYVQRLPEQQRQALEQFTRFAVRRVELQHANALDKHSLAFAFTTDLFKSFRLPLPEEEAIHTAIEAAVYDLNAPHKAE